jgi:hypothetical protein
VAPRKKCGAQVFGITLSTKESDLKYLKNLPNKKGGTVMCAAEE